MRTQRARVRVGDLVLEKANPFVLGRLPDKCCAFPPEPRDLGNGSSYIERGVLKWELGVQERVGYMRHFAG